MATTDTNNDSAERFALLELDDVAPPKAPKPAPDIVGVTVRAESKALGDTEAALATKHGIVFEGEPFFAVGTKMMAEGEHKVRQARLAWEKQPLLADGAAMYAEAIKAEQRRETVVKLSDLRVNLDGNLMHRQGTSTGLVMTPWSWSQLAGCAPSRDNHFEKYNVNGWLGTSTDNKTLRSRDTADRKGRELMAVVSAKYAKYDADEVILDMVKILPKDTRVAIQYNRKRTIATALLMPVFDVGNVGVGRMHRVAVTVRTGDMGNEGYDISLSAIKIRCINATLLRGKGNSLARRHVGNPESLRAAVRELFNNVAPAMEEFSALWREGNERRIIDDADGTPLSVETCFRRLIKNGYLSMPTGAETDPFVAALMQAWEYEPGDSYRAIHDAVTRLAHTGSWQSAWVTEELEEQASELLYARVWDPSSPVFKSAWAALPEEA